MEQILQISFTGEYNYIIDSKGRLNIPSKFRNVLNPVNNSTFILTKGFDNCLILYPVEEWKKVEEQLKLLSSIKKRHRSFIRSIVRHAVPVTYDKQGRIPIPANLLGFAGIEKDVTIIGMIKKIELWNPAELEKHEQEIIESDSASFEDLADDINF